MWEAIRNVIFAFAAVCCALMGVFWLWFMYQFSLRWLTPAGEIGPEVGTAVVFGREGAAWIGVVAMGWFMLALLLSGLHWWFVIRRQSSV